MDKEVGRKFTLIFNTYNLKRKVLLDSFKRFVVIFINFLLYPFHDYFLSLNKTLWDRCSDLLLDDNKQVELNEATIS